MLNRFVTLLDRRRLALSERLLDTEYPSLPPVADCDDERADTVALDRQTVQDGTSPDLVRRYRAEYFGPLASGAPSTAALVIRHRRERWTCRRIQRLTTSEIC